MMWNTVACSWNRKRRRDRWKPDKMGFLFFISFLLHSVCARPYLIFANKKDIRLIEVTNRRARIPTTLVVKDLGQVAALDFVISENKVCWTELRGPAIKCSVIDPRKRGRVDKVTIVESGVMAPEGLACDWINKNIYWTDSSTKRIEVIDMDEASHLQNSEAEIASSKNLEDPVRHRKVLIWENLDMPRAIVLAPHEGLMFWTDWGDVPRIERASMDGDPDSRMTIVDSNIVWPNGITLDYKNRKLFWIDAKLHQIFMADWEGRNRREIRVENQMLPRPFAISYFDQELYWTDWKTLSLYMFNITRPGISSPEKISVKKNLEPMDIKVFEPKRQGRTPGPCSSQNGRCSHLCLPSEGESIGYSCACPTGLKMLDNQTCAQEFDQVLLIAVRTNIRKISLDTPDFSDILLKIQDEQYIYDTSAFAINFDPVKKHIYWTDQVSGAIHRAFLNGSGYQEVVIDDIDDPGGLAIDWLTRNLFWTDRVTNRIEVARLDGSYRKTLISRNLDEPRAITIDAMNGWIYWSDWGNPPKIERAWLDGSHQETIISHDLGWPNGVALDTETQNLYWCDAKMDRIEMSNVDGSGRRTLIDDTVPHPFGLSVFGNYIYWTDWHENVLQRADKYNGEDRTILMTHVKELMDVHATNTHPDLNLSNECSNDNGGCSHLCLMTPEGKSCHCPDGKGYELNDDQLTCFIPEAFLIYSKESNIGRLSLRPSIGNAGSNKNNYILPISEIIDASALDFDRNEKKLYWSDIEERTINRAFMNGSDAKVVIEFGLGFVDGLAIDWNAGNIYWTDMSHGKIEVARTTGLSRRVLIWKDLSKPCSIALNPSEGVMYWSSWGDDPVIEQANLDGSDRQVFKSDVGKTNGLTIDYDTSRIYWTDLDAGTICYSTLQFGQLEVKTVILESPKPYSVTLFRNEIYWTDWNRTLVGRADKNTGDNTVILEKDITRIMDLNVFHHSRQVGQNSCQNNNIGCSDLCLFSNGEPKCSCPSHFQLGSDQKSCSPPEKYLIFAQKNRISRLFVSNNDLEVPDVVLPIRGGRDIHALSHDTANNIIYWIDFGSKRKNNVSIKRAFTNGTLIGRRLQGSRDYFNPYDLVYDPVTSSIFLSCVQSGSINITKVGSEEQEIEDNLGAVISGKGDKPTYLAMHPFKGLIFWINLATPVRIERAQVDGKHRTAIVTSSLAEPRALTVDTVDNLVFWSDGNLIERSDLNGEKRKVLFQGDVRMQVTSLAIQDNLLLWMDKQMETINKMNKYDGNGMSIVKAGMNDITTTLCNNNINFCILFIGVPHMSAMISVNHLAIESLPNACQGLPCSHLCHLNPESQSGECACPVASGLVLDSDDLTCKYPPTCEPNNFACKYGSPACIPSQWRCDGQTECSDHSDEMDCPECGPGQFKCGSSGQCINGTLLCDGNVDCPDSRDEVNCCPKNTFRCTVSGECIDHSKRCDGRNDCSDGSDEISSHCNAVQATSTFRNSNTGMTTTSTVVVVALTIVFVFALLFVVFCYIFKKKNKQNNNDQIAMTAIPQSRNQYNPDGMAPRYPPAADSLTASQAHLSSANAMPCVFGEDDMAHIPGVSSYDRNHLTGASSSNGSSSLMQLAGPRSTTAVRRNVSPFNGRHTSTMPHRSHTPRLHYNTPCSTDVNDESDVHVSYSVHRRRHYPSVNSECEGEYSENYYLSDTNVEDERSIFLNNDTNQGGNIANGTVVMPEPPPNSREPSPSRVLDS